MAERVKSRQAWRSVALLTAFLVAGCEIVPDPAAPETAATAASPAARHEARQPVALLAPLSGPNSTVGRSIANAVDLALAEGAGRRLRVTTYDTGEDPAAAARDALAAGHRLLLGPLLAEDVRVVAPLARAAGVPLISFSNDAGVAGQGVYLLGLTPAQSIERVVVHARGQGVERFAALVPAGRYGERAREALASAVQRSGGQVVAVRSYPRSPGAARAAARLLGGGAQAVLIADGARVAAEVAPAIRGVRILGTELWAAEPGLAGLNALHGAWFAAAPTAGFDQFRPRYRARFEDDPYRLASLGYDAAQLAAALAGSWPAGQPFPEASLRSRRFDGLDGPFRFWRDGVADRGLDVLEVGPGGTITVATSAS